MKRAASGRMFPRAIALVAAAAIAGCTGRGPTGAPPLERFALLPVQLIALPFMILRPFAPLIQAGMQAGIQMAPYALLFCQNEPGPSERILACVRQGDGDGAVPSLPLMESYLAEDGTVREIIAVDLSEIGGEGGVRGLLSAMERNGIRCRWVIVDAADILTDGESISRLRDVLVERGVTLYTTGGLSALVADRFGTEFAAAAPDGAISRSFREAFGCGAAARCDAGPGASRRAQGNAMGACRTAPPH